MTALKAFIKHFEAPQEVWKWKFNLIFISTQFSEMHGILRVKVRQNILGRYSWIGLNSGFYQFFCNKAKWWISKRVFPENKARQIFRKMNISYPLIRTCTYEYQGVRNVDFFWKFGVLCFLETPVLRFTVLPYYRRVRQLKNDLTSSQISIIKIWKVYFHIQQKRGNSSDKLKCILEYVSWTF